MAPEPHGNVDIVKKQVIILRGGDGEEEKRE